MPERKHPAPPSPPPRPEPEWWALHLWQIQPIRDLLVIAAIVGVVYLGYRLSVVTVPILLALLFAYLFEPLVRFMTRRGYFSRPGAVVTILLAAFALLVVPSIVGVSAAAMQGVRAARSIASTSGALLTVLRFSHNALEQGPDYGDIVLVRGDTADPDLVTEVTFQTPATASPEARAAAADARLAFARLPASLKNVAVNVMARHEEVQAAREGEGPAPDRELDAYVMLDIAIAWIQNNAAAIGQALGRQALGTGAGAITAVWRSVNTVIGLGLTLFLTIFFFYFFSTGYGRVLAFWERLIPERKKGRVIDLLRQMDIVIAGFVRGRLTISAILMLIYTAGYWMIGLSVPVLLGIIVGACTLVPYLALLALPVPIIIMALDPSPVPWQQAWWWILFAPIGVYMLGQAIDDYILTPIIQGRITQMDTPTILFASLAGGVLVGVYGLLIAIPVAACLKILLREVFWPRFKAWAEGREKDWLPIFRGPS